MRKKFSLFFIIIVVISICLNPTISLQSEQIARENHTDDILKDSFFAPTLEPFFTLQYTAFSGSPYPEYADLMKQQLAKIGINVEIELKDWGAFLDTLLVFHNFDITSNGFGKGGYDPWSLPLQAFTENGSLNCWGYHTDMDYDEVLGTGLNEWYIKQGNLIIPPNTEEAIQHAWDWQNYLQSDILPMKPLFALPSFFANWANLEGFNYAKGDILHNWGQMSWNDVHPNQASASEIVVNYDNWTELNPFYSHDEASSFIIDACLDELLYLDADCIAWPHLAESWNFIDDTTLDITLRDGIKWMDYGGFTNEYLDVKDLFFTLYCWQELSVYSADWWWLDDMEIIDDMTLRIFIDYDPGTTEKELYFQCLNDLNTYILPEHYLNQTQEADGVTPDIIHPSWVDYSTNCWGTDLFKIDDFTEAVETILMVKPDCWRLNPTITNDPELNYEERFGDYSGGLTQLRVRIMDDIAIILSEFEAGRLDLVDITSDFDKRQQYLLDPNFEVQSKATDYFNWIGFNLREARETPLQNTDPCTYLPWMTKGLAIRKAIAYAINRTEINNIVHNGEQIIWDYPNYPSLGIWNDPDIIRYNCNLTKAKEYMMYAGYDYGTDSDGDGLTDYEEINIYGTNIFSNDTDSDGLLDWDEVYIYETNPASADTDSDGLPDNEELFTYGTDPKEEDTDEDQMPDGWEIQYDLNPLNETDALDDIDQDGLTNLQEYNYNTDPRDDDSDDDGASDGDEINAGTDPLDPLDYPETKRFGFFYLPLVLLSLISLLFLISFRRKK